MKKTISKYCCAGIAGLSLAIAPMALAQSAIESTSTTTTTMGTVSEFDPQTIVIKSETAPEPIRYHYTKTTTYVDEGGNPVSPTLIRAGLPVKVFFDREGDAMVARKVVITRAVSAEPMAPTAVESRTTTTTTAGTISEFDPNTIVVRTESSAEPLRYRYTKTTTYVDESGNPVSIETVKSGLPVTIYYDREGGAMVARKVIVRRATTAPGAVIEHKKTTTTTTTE